MAFSLSDFKKTTRKVNGRQVLYPHQLRDDRYLAAISYAIDYYERMVGRPRHELQADTLLEFFGDPKLARGIVACLGRSYSWYQPSIGEVVGSETAATLRQEEIHTPIDLRALLYRFANKHHHGFLPSSTRTTALQELCATLSLDVDTFERLLTLDLPANAILTKSQQTSEARDIVNLYNYHSLETALRYSESLRLTLRGAIWPIIRTVHNLARRYGLVYTTDYGQSGLLSREATVTFIGTRDAFGGFRGSGRRIVRALLRLLATHPDAPAAGEAVVYLRGRTLYLLLDRRALGTLGAHAPVASVSDEAWEAGAAEGLQGAWSRAYLRGETGGWRLRRDPEPLVTETGVIVPDFALHRGPQRAALVLAETASAVEALIKPLKALGGRSLLIVSTRPPFARRLSGLPAIVVASADPPTPRLLATALPSPMAIDERHETRWQRLERLLATEGFVDEGRIAAMLDVEHDQLEKTLRGWHATDVAYLPGVGLCTAETVNEIRALLQPERRKAA